MAKYTNGFMGAFSGKLGPAVAYEWKGRQCLRSLGAVGNPRTGRQQRSRRVFGALSSLSAGMTAATRIGLRGAAADLQMSEFSLFMKLNHPCVALEDDQLTVDYPSLRVAQGSLPGVSFGSPQLADGRHVTVGFGCDADNPGSGSDYVYFFAFVPTLRQGFLSQPARRCSGRVDDELPAGWTGREAHLYGFVWDTDLSASDSIYLGTIALEQ